MLLHEDRLFPADPATRAVTRRLHDGVRDLPLVSPHGHTDPRWYAEDKSFPDPARLFVVPDHYVFRMLYSQGVPLEDLGIAPRNGSGRPVETDPRAIWRRFAAHYHLFRGTPTRLWLDPASRSGLPTAPSTSSRRRSPGPSTGPARSSHASTSRSSPRPRARSTTSAGIA
jgi:glucuronate isomerase